MCPVKERFLFNHSHITYTLTHTHTWSKMYTNSREIPYGSGRTPENGIMTIPTIMTLRKNGNVRTLSRNRGEPSGDTHSTLYDSRSTSDARSSGVGGCSIIETSIRHKSVLRFSRSTYSFRSLSRLVSSKRHFTLKVKTKHKLGLDKITKER